MFVLKLYINSPTQRIELNFDFLNYSENINIKELNGTQENLEVLVILLKIEFLFILDLKLLMQEKELVILNLIVLFFQIKNKF